MKAQKAPVRSKREVKVVAPAAPQSAANGVRPAPAWLTGRGLELFGELSPALRQAKLLTQVDETAFARYCRNLADWLKLRGELDAEGFTYDAESYGNAKDADKTTVLRRLDPRFLVSDRLERQLLAAEDRFGLNPSERQRIMVARSNTGYSGDLFSAAAADAANPAQPSQPQAEADPVAGFLH